MGSKIRAPKVHNFREQIEKHSYELYFQNRLCTYVRNLIIFHLRQFSNLRPTCPGPIKTPVLVQSYVKVNFYSVKQAMDPLIDVFDSILVLFALVKYFLHS